VVGGNINPGIDAGSDDLPDGCIQDQVKVVRMGVPDRIVTHGDAKLLLAKYGLDADGIYLKTKESAASLGSRPKSKPLRAVK
jgi:hypothetical protein